MEKRDVDKRQDSLAGASDTEGVGQRGLPMPARYAINALLTLGAILLGQLLSAEIGRASCRERV